MNQHDEWAIPKPAANPTKVEQICLPMTQPIVLDFQYQGNGRQAEIAIWAISADIIERTPTHEILSRCTHHRKLNIIVPMLNEFVPIGQHMLQTFVQDTQKSDYCTTPQKTGAAVEAVYGIGDADSLNMGICITIGGFLKDTALKPARDACNQIMEQIQHNRFLRSPAI